jgi:ABC-type glycerol-3-phosphate transport system substrate-binding protein
MDAYPNITIEYTRVAIDDFRTNIVGMLNSAEAPDIFPIPTGLTLDIVLNEGWLQPLTPLVTQSFIDSFDPRILVEGSTMKNGVLYTIPDIPMVHSLIYYNIDLLEAAGVTTLPTTFSEFREAVRLVTEAGNGEFYGIIEGGTQLGRLNEFARALTQISGGFLAPSGQALTLNGRAPYDQPEVIATLEFIRDLVADGSFHPDTVTINAPVAREMFGMGQAAFLMQGSWCVGPWRASNPELNFGVMAPPRIDGTNGALFAMPVTPIGYGISAHSDHPEAAALYLMAMYGHEFGFQAASSAEAGIFSVVKGINEQFIADPVSFQYFDIASAITVSAPMATNVDARVFDFYEEVVGVSPQLQDIFQGVLSGDVTDIAGTLTQLADAATAEWQRAANVVGVPFGVFEFPDWRPGVPYTG